MQEESPRTSEFGSADKNSQPSPPSNNLISKSSSGSTSQSIDSEPIKFRSIYLASDTDNETVLRELDDCGMIDSSRIELESLSHSFDDRFVPAILDGTEQVLVTHLRNGASSYESITAVKRFVDDLMLNTIRNSLQYRHMFRTSNEGFGFVFESASPLHELMLQHSTLRLDGMKVLSSFQLIRFSVQILHALQDCHRAGATHGRLSMQTVFVRDKSVPATTMQYLLAQRISKKSMESTHVESQLTAFEIGPELRLRTMQLVRPFRGNKCASDVWSFGAMLLYLATGHLVQLLDEHIEAYFIPEVTGTHWLVPFIENHFSEAEKQLWADLGYFLRESVILPCLDLKPSGRPSIEELNSLPKWTDLLKVKRDWRFEAEVNSRLQTEAPKLQNEVDGLVANLEAVEEEITTLNSAIDVARRQNEQLQNKISQLAHEALNLKIKAIKQDGECAELEIQTRENSAKIAEKVAKLESLKKELISKQSGVEHLGSAARYICRRFTIKELMEVSHSGNMDILRLLDRFGLYNLISFINERSREINAEGETPLTAASANNYIELVKQLLKHPEIDVNLADKGGTALVNAIRRGHDAVSELLITFPNVNINLQDKEGISPVMWAARYGHIKILRLLIERGCELNLRTLGGSTALMLAVRHLQFAAVEELIRNTAVDVNVAEFDGNSPLMIACVFNIVQCVVQLLAHESVVIEAKNKMSYTALMLAAENGHLEVVEKLIRHPRINLDSRNERNKTAEMLALDRQHNTIVHLIHKAKIEAQSAAASAITLASLANEAATDEANRLPSPTVDSD